ncbi:hypothetical protein GCM10011415_07610 [Salipiger pallidus]|uniref:Excalibur calcium-binding domain-containing protein n=1 Tax=Salipiger pallidus TaxID=1775170 RepID=A0A8J2ZH59_9RHOB|nr:hypothetical protein [Salipiger pallidus]GGG63625.1 hypothetical protein GCM10011415_07610 [Salipiger pallidus]
MKKLLLCGAATLTIAACTHSVPDSGAGVGFGDYDSYNAQQAQQAQGQGTMTVQAPSAVTSSTLDGTPIEDEAAARASAANSGQAPVNASPSNPAPQVVSNSAGISNENSFEAVSAERDIQADAALIAQNRSQYQIVTPTQLPPRPGSSRPNIVAYALQTTNPVGVSLYERRGRYAGQRLTPACNEYNSADLAQEAFLEKGGPERDRDNLDADGDGFACTWNPAPFRAARGG